MNEDLKRWDEEADDWINKIQPVRMAKYILNQSWPKLLGDLTGKKILDAGCGDGVFVEEFRKLSASVTGLDGSYKLLEFAKSNHPDANFVQADLLERLPFAEKSFDLVLSILVLMSLGNIDTFLKESKRILTESGRLIVCVLHPAFNFPTMKLRGGIWRKLMGQKTIGIVEDYFQRTTIRQEHGLKPTPFYHRTLSEYTKSFTDAGFSIKQIAEPHEFADEYLKSHPRHEYATRLPRFIIFDLQQT